MRSRLGFLVALLVAVVAAAAAAWRSGWMSPTPKPVVASPAPTPVPPPPLQSAWKTEQEWLVGRIARDVVTTVAWARTGTLPASAPGATTGGVTIAIGEHAFAPEPYAAFARDALAAGPGPTPASATRESAAEDRQLLARLLDLRTTVLLREDQALSRALSARPLDASAHERAALLLGAFALRDAAGRSTDVRPALCRLTSHLAFAAALRGAGEPGVAGRLAEAVLVTLVGREGDALARLDALEVSAPTREVRAWARALRLRNTGDWRIALDASDLTLLERLEEFRALVGGQGDSAALAWLDRSRPEPVLDWGLVALNAESASVESGNRFADVAPMLQLAEAGEAWTALGGKAEDAQGMMRALNERPEGLVTADAAGRPRVAVIGWGLWADRTHRHIVFEVMSAIHYYSEMLGRAGDARSYAEHAREQFGRLALYPVVLRGHAQDAREYRAAMAAAREVAVRSPRGLPADTGRCSAQRRTSRRFPGTFRTRTRGSAPPCPAVRCSMPGAASSCCRTSSPWVPRTFAPFARWHRTTWT